MKDDHTILREYSLSIIAFISGLTSVFYAATISEGLGFEPNSPLYLFFSSILTVVFFIAQFSALRILLGLLPAMKFLHYKVPKKYQEDDRFLLTDPEKIKRLKKTMKIK